MRLSVVPALPVIEMESVFAVVAAPHRGRAEPDLARGRHLEGGRPGRVDPGDHGPRAGVVRAGLGRRGGVRSQHEERRYRHGQMADAGRTSA
ncbi:MAG TPA: hypothetical protein VD695_02435, partial [Gaiellaceae bacterium]|nr:hypothetical protein [Gaiellaceae bacterium]